MINRLKENLVAALPIGAILGMWLALADSFHVVFTSANLLESIKTVSLVVAYGFLTSIIVALAGAGLLSIIVTLLDRSGKLTPARHAGRVTGVMVFVGAMAGLYFNFFRSLDAANMFDPRKAFPLIGCIAGAWLIARLAASHVGGNYDPAKWPLIVGRQYSIIAGLVVFVFGACMAQYLALKEDIYLKGVVFLRAENIIYYVLFFILGIIVWRLMLVLTSRAARRKPVIPGIILLFIILPLVIFMRPSSPPNPDSHNPSPSGKGRNVMLISVDTLRYDRLGCNGNQNIMTPNIDSLADEGYIFDNCIVPMPLTLPSHTSMLTGLFPRNHGLRVQDYHLSDSIQTLAEALSSEGLTTGGFVSMAMLRGRSSNLDQGFNYYDDSWIYKNESRYFPPEVKFFFAGKVVNKIFTGEGSHRDRFERPAEETVDSTINWLDKVSDEDFFCFFHVFDAHWDYNAPGEFKDMYDPGYKNTSILYNRGLKDYIWGNKIALEERDIDHLIARYDGEVTYIDSQLGKLFDHMKKLGVWDNTMIILTADHGESFEHDYFFSHADRVYQSCIHVPLIIKPFGGASGERRDTLVTNADFFPTFLDSLGVNPPDDIDGESLILLLNDTPPTDFNPHPAMRTESYAFDNYNPQHYGRTYSVIDGGKKLIYSPYAFPYAPRFQYYDLTADPEETNNLYDFNPEASGGLWAILKKWVDQDYDPIRGVAGRIEIENMKSLQYLNN